MAHINMALTGSEKETNLDRLNVLLIAIFSIELLLIAAYFLTESSEHSRFQRFFHLDREANLPTWFSSTQLLLVGIMAFLTALLARRVSSTLQIQLCLFAAVFVFLSMDEASTFHETISIGAIKFDLPFVPSFNSHGAWIVPYCLLALAFMLYLRRSILWVWRRDQAIVLCAALGFALFVGGAVGVELTSYYIDRSSLYGLIQVAIEEGMEMAGASLVLYAIARLYLYLSEGRS